MASVGAPGHIDVEGIAGAVNPYGACFLAANHYDSHSATATVIFAEEHRSGLADR
jgi:hypothetical protein